MYSLARPNCFIDSFYIGTDILCRLLNGMTVSDLLQVLPRFAHKSGNSSNTGALTDKVSSAESWFHFLEKSTI